MILIITTLPTGDPRILPQRARPRSTETDERQRRPPSDNLALTTEIVAAFVANHAIAPPTCRPDHHRVQVAGRRRPGRGGRAGEPARPEPAVPVRKSVQREFIVCLEDGKKVKTLKRYLATRYKPDAREYRQRWGLPNDYPMVAPAYAELRSTMARQFGLGRKPRRRWLSRSP
jgi:predicted transcriptional regulator